MKPTILKLAILLQAVCLTGFATDIYAPAIPAIAHSLNASMDSVQWTMSVYMLGVAISHLFYGPVSEAFGRKSPMCVGLVIMLLGSLICMLSKNVEMLILGRFVQGCGAGACASLWRAVFRDCFTGEELAQYTSYLVIFIMFISPSAPLLGGYLQAYFGWNANFVFMFVYSLIALLGLIFFFSESHQNINIENLRPALIIKQYKTLVRDPLFMGVTLATFLSFGALFTWFVIGPVLLIEKLGILPTTFGWICFLGCGSAYGLAGFLNGRLVKRFGMTNMLRLGWSIMLSSGILMATGYSIFGLSLWPILVPVMLFYFGTTFIWPNAFATAFTPFGHIAGYAGAMYGFMQLGGAAVMAGLAAYLPDDNQLGFSLIIILCSLMAWLTYEKVKPTTPFLSDK